MKNNEVYIIAEMACSHEGDPHLARKIIDGAGQAKANAIQLQIWSATNMMVPQNPEYRNLQKLEISQDEWAKLVKYTRRRYPQMNILVFAYEHNSIDFIEGLGVDGYKVNSADLSNPCLFERTATTGKRINLGIGAATISEIQVAIERIRSISQSEIYLMYGHQDFLTHIDDIHLNYMMKLKGLFELPMGYKDHSDAESETAFWLPAALTGMGVDILEKHITHNRAFKGADHKCALNPDEFKRFVSMVRKIESFKGVSIPKSFSNVELKYRKFQKKSIVACRNLPSGTRLKDSDFLFLQAKDLGLAPDKINKLLGRVTKKDICAYDLITEEDLI